jgi:predicted Fe-S protein YdhL (DUF1289 family)
LLSLKSFVAKKRHVAMQNLFIKKERKRKELKKWTSVRDIQKQWVLRCLPEKEEEEMNKIAHVFLQSCFQIPKERGMFSRSKVELG